MKGKENQTSSAESEQEPIYIAILTDLDGTLLDHHTYSVELAMPAFMRAKIEGRPVIPVTSKTWAEISAFQREVGTYGVGPAVVENGGASYIPKNFINFDPREVVGPERKVKDEKGFWIIEYAKPIEQARTALTEMADVLGIKDNIKTFGQMTDDEFCHETGLPIEKAKLALQRDYQEGYRLIHPPQEKAELEQRMKVKLEELGFNLTIGGRFYQVTGGSDKGLAARDLIRIMQKQHGKMHTIGLGDAVGDLPMLEACGEGYLVANPNGLARVNRLPSKIHKVSGVGPEGWNEAVNAVLDRSKKLKNKPI